MTHVVDVVHTALLLVVLLQRAVAVKLPAAHIGDKNETLETNRNLDPRELHLMMLSSTCISDVAAHKRLRSASPMLLRFRPSKLLLLNKGSESSSKADGNLYS